MFTRQHYKAIAEIIGKAENLEDLEKRIIELFRDDNERFDNWRFSAYIKDIRDANRHTTEKTQQEQQDPCLTCKNGNCEDCEITEGEE